MRTQSIKVLTNLYLLALEHSTSQRYCRIQKAWLARKIFFIYWICRYTRP